MDGLNFAMQSLWSLKISLRRRREDTLSALEGIVEAVAATTLLKHYSSTRGPVEDITCPLDDIIAYLDGEGSRPAYGESVADIFKRREP